MWVVMGLAERCLERLATIDPASQVVPRHLGRCGLREVFHGQFRLPNQTVVVDYLCVHTLRLFLSILPRPMGASGPQVAVPCALRAVPGAPKALFHSR